MQKKNNWLWKKGINSTEWVDREEWGRKIKLKPKAQKVVRTLKQCR